MEVSRKVEVEYQGVCTERLEQCPSCGILQAWSHQGNCREEMVSCDICDEKVRRKDLEAHERAKETKHIDILRKENRKLTAELVLTKKRFRCLRLARGLDSLQNRLEMIEHIVLGALEPLNPLR